MEQQTINQEILEKLKQLQTDVNVIKENLVDPDTILTPEEEKRHEESLRELERGETFSLEDVEKARAKNVGFRDQ
jgi:hypothetical protein